MPQQHFFCVPPFCCWCLFSTPINFCSLSSIFIFGSISLLIFPCYHFFSFFHHSVYLYLSLTIPLPVYKFSFLLLIPSQQFWLWDRCHPKCVLAICCIIVYFGCLYELFYVSCTFSTASFFSLFWSHQIYTWNLSFVPYRYCYCTVRVSPCGGMCFGLYQTDTIVTNSLKILPSLKVG